MARLTNLDSVLTYQVNVTASGTPEQLLAKIRGTTISFTHVGGTPHDTISDSGSGFLLAGFEVGDAITVSGSGSNDGTYTIESVVAGTITVTTGNLTTEVAGATVKITAPKALDDGIEVIIKGKSSNTGTITLSGTSARAVSGGGGGFTLGAGQAVGLQVSTTSKIWIDASVTAEGVEVLLERSNRQ